MVKCKLAIIATAPGQFSNDFGLGFEEDGVGGNIGAGLQPLELVPLMEALVAPLVPSVLT